MAHLSEDQVQRIVAEQMPGFKVVEPSVGIHAADSIEGFRVRVAPEAATPSTDALHKKYGHYEHSGGSNTENFHEGEIDKDDLTIRRVVPDVTGQDNAVMGAGSKAVIISAKEQKIIGQQG